jgi:hypothetical protein
LSLFKKIAELFKAPTNSDAHNDWFYHTKVFSKKILIFYRQAMAAEKDGNTFIATDDIVPLEISFGLSIAETIDKWGKPRATFNNKKDEHNIRVLFYRKNFVYENALFQLQFYNNRLFFISVEVGKSMMPNENKINMLNNMLPNHIATHHKEVHDVPVIKDRHQNFLLVEDAVVLNICYLSGEFVGEKIFLLEEAKKHESTKKDTDD